MCLVRCTTKKILIASLLRSEADWDCGSCQASVGLPEKFGCKEEVSHVVIKKGPYELHRCPFALLQDMDSYVVQQIFDSYDYRQSGDFMSRPAWLVDAWNLVSSVLNSRDKQDG